MARPRRSPGLPAHLRPSGKSPSERLLPPALPDWEKRLRASAVSLEDLEALAVGVEDLERLNRNTPQPGGEAERSAAIARAVQALEEVAAGVNKRQRERIAGFRRYLENLPRQSAESEEESEAKRQGKRIGRKAFAALVGVSPKTLLDWHTSGVFEPAYIDPKGWRFYTFEQVAEAKALLRKRKR